MESVEDKKVTLTVRCVPNAVGSSSWTPNIKEVTIFCTLDWTIGDIKTELESLVDLPVPEQRLIWNKRLLENQHSIKFYFRGKKESLYLLRSKATEPITRLPQNMFGDVGTLNNPIMDQILANPDILQHFMESNPQLQELRQRVPEVGALLSDSETLRTTLEAMRNTNVMREMMRSSDRALSQIDSIPGGHDALRRIYRAMNENSEIWDSNHTDSVSGSGNNYNLQNDEPPSTEPIPNPWGTPENNVNGRSAVDLNLLPSVQSALLAPVNPVGSPGFPPIFEGPGDLNTLLQAMNGAQTSGRSPPEVGSVNHENFSNERLPMASTGFQYQSQKQALLDMGFVGEARIIRILEDCKGNINQAIDKLSRD